MAEEGDPRDMAWHPRRRHGLVGHQTAENLLLTAHRSGKLHHAWLIGGPRGIGKATLAYRFARFLMQHPDPGPAASLDVAPESAVSHQVAAGAHPDLLVVEPAYDTKNKKVKSEIIVADARRAVELVGLTAAAGGWRIVIVDAADDLNDASANALLKSIEEPPQKCVFLLVSHRPGSLLSTIRSRCLHITLSPLSNADTVRVLHEVVDGERDLSAVAGLARGSPGRALELLGSKGAAAFESFQSQSRLKPSAMIEIANGFAARDAASDFAIFFDLLSRWTADRARDAARNGGGAELAKAHAEISHSIQLADALNLDRRQTVIDALMLLDEALKAA